MPQPTEDTAPDDRLFFPATERNRDVLGDVLVRWCKPGQLLEVASGSGEHAVHIAPRLSGVQWQPTDLDPAHLKSIAAWRAICGVEDQVKAPLALDVISADWSDLDLGGPVTTLLSVNLIHIAPPEALFGVIKGATTVLGAGARLIFYGPFMVDGAHTSESNAQFDASLKARDPSWGVRDRSWVTDLAGQAGFNLQATLEMPANNQTLVFERDA